MTTTAIKERPILFSGPMVLAILEGMKTQTRRIARFKPLNDGLNLSFSGLESDDQGVNGWALASRDGRGTWNERTHLLRCPYGLPGDRLWVRETWTAEKIGREVLVAYRASCRGDEFDFAWKDGSVSRAVVKRWKPSIFMPREVSRITLEVTKVRIERLQSITADDVLAEGLPAHVHLLTWKKSRRSAWRDDLPPLFGELWDKLNAKRGFGWETNPWVWVIEFKRC